MEKVIRDGKVAVIYSPGYGAGWSTWCHDDDTSNAIIFDPHIVKCIEDDNRAAIVNYCQEKYFTDAYIGGNIRTLTIEWLPVGTRFYIDEYDGNESVVTESEIQWNIA